MSKKTKKKKATKKPNIERDVETRRRAKATNLAKELTKRIRIESVNRYELGELFNIVLLTQLWDCWPRTVRRRGRQETYGYATFEEWCWNECGKRGSTARHYAAFYRRFELLGLPKANPTLHKHMLAIGIQKANLVLRGALRFMTVTNEGEPDMRKALAKAELYTSKVSSQQLNEVATKHIINVDAEQELSLPECRPPALPLKAAPLKRPADWRHVDNVLREVSYLAASCDKQGVVKGLEKALKKAKAVRS